MSSELHRTITTNNARLTILLEHTRGALRGEYPFGSEQIRSLSQPLSEMAPLAARSKELTAQHPDLASVFGFYRQQLIDLRATLDQIRIVLLARRAQLEQARLHVDAVSHWASATRLIR